MSGCRSCGCSSDWPSPAPSPAGSMCAGGPGASPPAALVLLFGSSFVLYLLVPALFQRLYVKPSELRARDALYRAQHRLDAAGLQPAADRGEAVPGRGRLELRLARGQPRDRRQHPPVGLAAADGHLCPAPGDQDLLQVPRHGHRPLSAGRRLSAGDAVGARARTVAAAVQCADLGQPASCSSPTATAW